MGAGKRGRVMQNSADIVPFDEERSKRAAAPRLDNAGAMLRAAREDASLSLARVAEAINIKEARLAAIEAMDLEALPSAPYTMGFVRAYADHLGLPVEPLVARFREEAGYVRTVTAPRVAPPPKDLSEGKEVRLLAVLALVGFVLWCVWQIAQAFAPEEETALPSGFPIADRTEVASIEYEVATSLEEDLRLAPPAVVTTAAVAAAESAAAEGVASDSGNGPAEDAGQAAPPVSAPPVSAPDAEVGATDAARPGLLPSVLVSPTLSEPAPDEPPVPAPAAERRRTADLNERLLLETLAASAPGRVEAAQTRGAAPDDGPITASAAPAARRPVETVALPTEPVPAEPTLPVRPEPAPVRVVAETPAQLTVPVPPVYPTRCESRANDRETVTVRFNVSRFGKVTGPSVIDSSNACFDRAALNAVARFAFEPATRDGRPVPESERTTRVVFRKP